MAAIPSSGSSMASSIVISSTTASSMVPLSTEGLDMTNSSVQADFLEQLLDDTEIQITANYYARSFWYGVVVVITLAALCNLVLRVVLRSRIRAAAVSREGKSIITITKGGVIGVVSAAARKISYLQISPFTHPYFAQIPPIGTIILVILYLVFILGLEYIHQDVQGAQHYQAIGIRAGWLTITQLPLLILLSGKVNLIGLLTGVSYERLNVLHRAVARTMLLTATLHVGYQLSLWNSLGLLKLEWDTDSCFPTGIKAYAFLVWLNLSTLTPIRNLWYEFFVVQHILSFFAFIVFIMLHLPDTALYTRIYIYIPIGLYLLDRFLRSARYAYNNIRPGRATLIQESGGVTRVIVKSRQVKNWAPGSFVLLSIPRFGIGQSHPATIASTPSSHGGDLVFFLRKHRGFTMKIHQGASTRALQSQTDSEPGSERVSKKGTHLALIDGMYGGKHLDFASFNTVVLIAGSTGVTFTLPILLDLAQRSQKATLPAREIVFVWVVKSVACLSWAAREIQQATEELNSGGIYLNVQVYVTCNDEFVEESDASEEGKETLKKSEVKGEESDIRSESFQSSSPVIGASNEKGLFEEKENISMEKSIGRTPRYQFSTPIVPYHGRPNIDSIIAIAHEKAKGEVGVAVCGPVGLGMTTRRVVAGLEGKGTGIYLHAESFGW